MHLYIFRHQLSILVSSSLHRKRLHLLHGWTASPVGSISCKGHRVLGSNATSHIPSYCPDVLKLSETYVSNMQEKKTPYPHTLTACLLQEASNSHTSTSISHFALSCASCSTLLHIAPNCSTNHRQWNQLTIQIYWASQKALLWQAICINMLHLKSFFKRISCDRSFGRVMPTYFHFSAFFGSGLGSLQERFSQSSPFLTTNSP